MWGHCVERHISRCLHLLLDKQARIERLHDSLDVSVAEDDIGEEDIRILTPAFGLTQDRDSKRSFERIQRQQRRRA